MVRRALVWAPITALVACVQLQGLDELTIADDADAATIVPDRDVAAPNGEDARTDADGSAVDASTSDDVTTSDACDADLTTSANCGGCGIICATTEECASGACRLRPLGNGADGALDVTVTPTSTNTVASGGVVALAGARSVTMTSSAGFAASDLVLLHQTTGAAAGKYELATIANVDSATQVTLVRTLVSSYTTDAGAARAQIVRASQYTTVNVAGPGTLVASPWDGARGGILAFKATGSVTVLGNIDMSGRGFRGASHATTCAGGARYACSAANMANGFAGESANGPGAPGRLANGAGGGGGEDGQDCASGAGGGHAANGGSGVNGGGLACRNGAQLGGAGGEIAGVPDLATSLLFGGAGGEGGGDEDGAFPGAGGNGGGIVFIAAASMTIANGRVRADGTPGGSGVVSDPGCGGVGCGMGGGGGGAGGSVYLSASTLAVGNNRVTAQGDGGGACSCGGNLGGTGSTGRIAIAGAVTGNTQPDFVQK